MKKIYILLLVLLNIYLVSCARTVAPEEAPLTLELTLTLNQAVNTQSNIYVIAFSPTQNIKPTNPTIGKYYIFPGQNFDSEELQKVDNSSDAEAINRFYNNTFSSWEQFIYISNTNVKHISYRSGPTTNAPYFEKTITSNYLYSETLNFEVEKSETGKILKLVLDIEQLNFKENDTSYFNMLQLSQESKLKGAMTSLPKITFKKYEQEQQNVNMEHLSKWEYRIY